MRAPLLLGAALSLALASAAGAAELGGVWRATPGQAALRPVDGGPVPLREEAKAIYAKRAAALKAGDRSSDPLSECLPPGVPRLLTHPMPFKIVRGGKVTVFLFGFNRTNREIYTSGERFEAIGPAYLGQSFGKWDGEALTVETANFNEVTWLDDGGLPHSDALRLSERFQVRGDGLLEDRILIDDPKTFTRPWTAVLTFRRLPAQRIAEDYCLGRTGVTKPDGN